MKLKVAAGRDATQVATDGAARKGWLCAAWLSDIGGAVILTRPLAHGLGKAQAALHAELYALAAAESAHPQAVTLLSDCLSAVRLIAQWQAGITSPVPGYHGRSLVVFSRRVRARAEPLTVEWVRGHARHPLNEGADALASLGLRAHRDGLTTTQVRERAAGIATAFSTPEHDHA